MPSIAVPIDALDFEEKLLERAVAGDVHAFERLYRQHVGRVHALCLRLTRNVPTAEDCTQQTFIKAWSALPGFETRSSVATWLHRIAVNVVFDQRRRRSLKETSLDEAAHATSDRQWTVDTPVEISEIEAAIMALPEGARDVLVLSGIYGFGHAEVAGMLGIAEGTCKAQLHRARRLLRVRLNMAED